MLNLVLRLAQLSSAKKSLLISQQDAQFKEEVLLSEADSQFSPRVQTSRFPVWLVLVTSRELFLASLELQVESAYTGHTLEEACSPPALGIPGPCSHKGAQPAIP